MHSTPRLFTRFIVALLLLMPYSSLKGQEVAFADYRPMFDPGSGVPRCEVPKGIRVKTTDYGLALQFNRNLSWDAYRLEIKVTGPVERDGAIVSRVQYYDYGKEGYFPELLPGENYTVYARRLCGGSGRMYETTSDWVDLGRYQIRGQQSNSRNFNCVQMHQGLGVAVSQVADVWCTLQINGPTPVPQGTRYQLLVKEVNGSAGSDKLYYVMESNTYRAELLSPMTTYEVYIRAITGGEFTEFIDSCSFFKALTFTTLSPGSNPENTGSGTGPQCGSTAGTINLTPNPMSSLAVGDVFLVNGFPVKVVTVTGSPAGWTGTGILSVPFGQKSLQVTFSNAQINIFRNLYSGSVLSVRMPLTSIPYLNIPAINIGGDICVPAASEVEWDSNGNHKITGKPWDSKGFGQDGKYRKVPPYPGWEPGDPTDSIYDPYGFDVNGNHRNGGRYDECGCDVNGLNANGAQCDKACQQIYSWLPKDSTAEKRITEEGALFAKQLGDTLRQLLLEQINKFKAETAISVTRTRTTCDSLRTIVQATSNQLNYSNAHVFLEENRGLNEGMSTAFLEMPKPLVPSVDNRNANNIKLENHHIALYKCDASLFYLKEKDSLWGAMASEIDELYKKAQDWVKGATAKDVELWQNRDSLKSSIANWLKIKFNERTIGIGVVPEGNAIHYYSEVADSRVGFEDLSPAFTRIQYQGFEKVVGMVALEEALDQGWEKIYGIDRAFFIQAIADAKAALVPFNAQDGEMAPLNIKKEVLGRNYNMYLDNFVFTPNSATCNVHFILEIPNSGNQIAFTLTGTTIQVGGFPQEKIKLALATNVHIRISNAMRMTLQGNTNPLLATAVDFDCRGFAGMQLNAELEVCRDFLIPVNLSGQALPDPERVKGKIEAYIAGWNDLLVSINITPFKVNKVSKISWSVQQFTLDFSDTRSPNATFPLGYTSEYAVNGVPSPLWKGMYVQSIGAKYIASGKNQPNDTTSVSIAFNNVVFDDTGLSGYCEARTNLLSLEKGNAGGWPFSIESLKIKLLSNSIASLGMGGQIKLPLFSTPLGYDAYVDPSGDLKFTVRLNDSLRADALFADIRLDRNSTVSLSYTNDEWLTLATLNGTMFIGKPDTKLAIKGIQFANLQLTNKAPYISIGTWSFNGSLNQELAGFKLNVSSPTLSQMTQERVRVGLGIGVSLGDKELGITAKGGISIYGRMEIVNGRHKWVNDGFGLDSVIVRGDLGGVSIDGELYFYQNDPVFGDGFQGILKAEFKKISIGALDAVAQFGSVENQEGNKFKYYMVDAMITLPKGVPIGGAIAIKGFGGGISNKMQRVTPASGLPLPDSNHVHKPQRPIIGRSLSGANYIPNDTMGLGLKAIAQLVSTSNEKIFSANVSLEFVFGAAGGIKTIAFSGRAQMLAPIPINIPVEKGTGRATNSSICGYVDLKFDFQNEVFDGDFSVDIFTPGGFLSGNGDAKIYANFRTGIWYIYVGTPQNPFNVNFNLLGVNVASTAYFCVGNKVPDIPPLPHEVASLTGVVGGVPNSMRSSGRGIVFGASFTAGSSGDVLRFLFYNFEVELGADVMLKQYPGLICAHNNQEIGIDGWYATGQAWAKVKGLIKIDTRLFGKRVNYTIADLAAAAAIQVRLPNPFYAEGGVGGRYNILGGLIKGSFKFKFEVGKTCKPIEGNGGGTQQDIPEIVQNITPMDKTTDVELDVKPKIEMAIPLETPFDCETSVAGNTIQCLTKLKNITMVSKSSGIHFPFEKQMNADKTVIDLKPEWYLYSNDTMEIRVEVAVLKQGVEIKTETKVSEFTTGGRIEIIPLSNIQATYPAINQKNFYKREYSAGIGFVSLDQAQGELFEDFPSRYYNYKVKFYPKSGTEVQSNFTYSQERKRIEYPMPADQLQNNMAYTIAFVIESKRKGNSSTSGSDDFYATTSIYPSGQTASGSNRNSVEFAGEQPISKEILSYQFRVSHYDKFGVKLAALMNTATTDTSGGYSITYSINGIEQFDGIEMYGFDGHPPCIELRGTIHNSEWYINGGIEKHLYNFVPELKDPYFLAKAPRGLDVGSQGGDVATSYPPNDAVGIRQVGRMNVELGPGGGSTGAAKQEIYFAIPSAIKEQLGEFQWALEELFKTSVISYFCECTTPQKIQASCSTGFGTSGDKGCFEERYGSSNYATAPEYVKVYKGKYKIPRLSTGTYPVTATYKLPGTHIITTVSNIDFIK